MRVGGRLRGRLQCDRTGRTRGRTRQGQRQRQYALVARNQQGRFGLAIEQPDGIVQTADAPAAQREDLVAGGKAGLLAGAAAEYVGDLDAGQSAFGDAYAEPLGNARWRALPRPA